MSLALNKSFLYQHLVRVNLPPEIKLTLASMAQKPPTIPPRTGLCADRKALILESTHTLARTVAARLCSFAGLRHLYRCHDAGNASGYRTGSSVWPITDVHSLLRIVAIAGASMLLVTERWEASHDGQCLVWGHYRLGTPPLSQA
jgi:hypothetical protein